MREMQEAIVHSNQNRYTKALLYRWWRFWQLAWAVDLHLWTHYSVHPNPKLHLSATGRTPWPCAGIIMRSKCQCTQLTWYLVINLLTEGSTGLMLNSKLETRHNHTSILQTNNSAPQQWQQCYTCSFHRLILHISQYTWLKTREVLLQDIDCQPCFVASATFVFPYLSRITIISSVSVQWIVQWAYNQKCVVQFPVNLSNFSLKNQQHVTESVP